RDQARGDGCGDRSRSGVALGPRDRRRPRADDGAAIHQPAIPAQAGRAPDHPGGLMATIVSPNGRPRRARKKKEARRWVREAQAIVVLAAAGFVLIALASFDPTVPPGEQHDPVGPVGTWLGWVFFRAFGYGGFLFPLLLVIIALSAFIRPLVAHGWPPFVGVGIIFLSATGLLAETSVLLAPESATIDAGGIVGWGVAAGLHASLGDVGTWLVLVAGMPIGVLFITQVSYS